MVDLDRLRDRLPYTTWFGVGLFGALGFAVGLWQPAWRHVPGMPYVEWLVAAGAGAVAYLGLSFGYDAREEERRDPRKRPLTGRAREISIAPSLEVYRPPPVSPPHESAPPAPEDPTTSET